MSSSSKTIRSFLDLYLDVCSYYELPVSTFSAFTAICDVLFACLAVVHFYLLTFFVCSVGSQYCFSLVIDPLAKLYWKVV